MNTGDPAASDSSVPAGMLRAGFELHQAPVAALTTLIIPLADMFHVVHLGVADLSLAAWSLKIGGMVGCAQRMVRDSH